MAQSFKPYQSNTIDAYISAGKALKTSESTLAFKSVIDNEVVITYYNVITKYYRIIQPYIENVELTDDEYIRYKNKPNLYCYEIYGTPELASSLLYINNMVSVTDFQKRKFKQFSSNILSIVNELMSLNEMDLKKNRIENNIE